MKPRTKIILTAALLACCPLSQANADIYQYTDKNGVLHFTNVNGGGKNQKRVSSERASSAKTRKRTRPTSSSGLSSVNSPSAYLDIINNACNRHGVDPSLVQAMIKVESDFNPYALSGKGAMGLMQLMPQTAIELNVSDSFNPAENIDAGVRYMRYLIDRYEGNLSLALAAYNSGETAVKRWGTIPPFKETQNYVKRIMKIYNGESPSSYIPQFTIYMGTSEDGALILTDNPSNHPGKKLTARKKNL